MLTYLSDKMHPKKVIAEKLIFSAITFFHLIFLLFFTLYCESLTFLGSKKPFSQETAQNIEKRIL
jgi:hypothetical protein